MKLRTKRLGILGACIAFVLLFCSIFSSWILRTSARAWVINSTPETPVDAIIIPGGGLETRPFGAARLFHEGVSNTLVLFETEVRPSQALGLSRASHEVTIEVLGTENIPEKNIKLIRAGVTSTNDEVIAVRKWAEENGIRSLVIVTDIFPSRRVRRAYRKGLSDLDIEVFIHTVPAHHYSADNWWENEHGLIAFQNEIIKYFYYLVRY